MKWRFGQLAEVRPIRAGTARFARQNAKTVPGMPRITQLPGLKRDTVGFLWRDCTIRRRHTTVL